MAFDLVFFGNPSQSDKYSLTHDNELQLVVPQVEKVVFAIRFPTKEEGREDAVYRNLHTQMFIQDVDERIGRLMIRQLDLRTTNLARIKRDSNGILLIQKQLEDKALTLQRDSHRQIHWIAALNNQDFPVWVEPLGDDYDRIFEIR